MRSATLGVMVLLGTVLVLAVGCPNDMALQSAAGTASLKQEPGTCTFMVRKFNDVNGNGELDANDLPEEPEIEWPVYWRDPNGAEFSATAPVWCIEANGLTGTWTFWEGAMTGWTPTAAMVDWEFVEGYPDLTDVIEIEITGVGDETYEIIFLNTGEGGGQEDCNLLIRKVNDLNQNGEVDPGEPDLEWPVTVTDPNAVDLPGLTDLCVNADILGIWTVEEVLLDNWFLTGVYVNGVPITPATASVEVEFTCDEEFEIVFLNATTCPPPDKGQICARKVYDAEGDGCDEWDPPIEGFLLCLTGTTNGGAEVRPLCEFTNAEGVVCWTDLEPGFYTVCEILPEGEWYATTPECVDVELCAGEHEEVCFANFCAKKIEMKTKGWWQNKHGCAAIEENPELLDALNALAPFQSGTFFTTGRDNCTGERCETVVLPFDSNSELGCFLVAPNSQSRVLQLMQQLAAFVLNVQYQTGSLDLYFPMLDMTAQEIVDAAIEAWMTGVDVSYWTTVLDRLNNAGTIYIVSPEPCEIVYENFN